MKGSTSRSLTGAVLERLRGGPAHTLDLAREVLGLQGHAGAAAAAVFQLLGGDSRFSVDARGTWTLVASRVKEAVSLKDASFAVVDVETTGGSRNGGDRITEFALVEVREGVIVDEFSTLVNPGRRIPPRIMALTGISDDMVRGAPYFEDIAGEVERRLEGRVFVAHNAPFDWGFVAMELVRAGGDQLRIPRLCTVRMVRRLVPELRHRNLDVVARHFGVDVHARHRAHGDALATARILLRLLDEAEAHGIRDLRGMERFLDGRKRRNRRGVSAPARPAAPSAGPGSGRGPGRGAGSTEGAPGKASDNGTEER
ncbi:MAG: PolC-type DNA polymerase III [Gemmatimonadota bacterium]